MRFIDFGRSHVLPTPKRVLHQHMKKVERKEGRPKLTLHAIKQLRDYRDQYTVKERERLQQIQTQYGGIDDFDMLEDELIDESEDL